LNTSIQCAVNQGQRHARQVVAAGTAEGVPSHKKSKSATMDLRFGQRQGQWRQHPKDFNE